MAASNWLKARFETFLFVPHYFKAISKEWMNILFGEGLIAVVFLVWWALGNPPLVLIFVSAMFVAGYFAWRVEHLAASPTQTSNRPANVLRRDWNGDWTSLANEFRNYAKQVTVRADWFHTSAGERWQISGGAHQNVQHSLQILCRNAGRL